VSENRFFGAARGLFAAGRHVLFSQFAPPPYRRAGRIPNMAVSSSPPVCCSLGDPVRKGGAPTVSGKPYIVAGGLVVPEEDVNSREGDALHHCICD